MKTNYSYFRFYNNIDSIKFYVTIFFICISFGALSQSTIYVNSISGDDTTGDGTSGNPFKSFHKGYISASSGDIIDLTGTFTWTDAIETGDVAGNGYSISKNLTIQGQSPINTIVQAHSLANTADRRVFRIANNIAVTFKNLAIKNGRGWTGWVGPTYTNYHGGAIGSDYGTSTGVNLSLENINISENYSPQGSIAGVYCEGTFSANKCTFQNNTKTDSSGGIALELEYVDFSKPRNIINCTFYNNTSTNSGAYAVFIDRRGANIVNCTFSNNTNAIRAYALYNNSHELYIVNSVIANSTGYDLLASSGNANGVKCINSIVEVEGAGSTAISYTNCLTGDQTNLNMGTVTTNDGNNSNTPYLNLLSGSVAINSGVTGNFGTSFSGGNITVTLTDQRGATRSGNTDMGSFEFGGTVLSLKPNLLSDIKIYPTITSGLININDNKTYEFYVYDMLGKEIKSGFISKQIDISNNINGMYFVKIKSEDSQRTFKVLLK